MSKQTHGGTSSGYDLDIDLANPHLEITPSIEIKDDFLVMVESAGELLLQQAEELSDTFTHTLEIIEQTGDSPASFSALDLSAAQLTQQADELSEANARLANYESEIARLSEILSEMRTQLRNKNEIINWIVRSRSWRITSVLRRLNFLRLKLRPGLRRAEQIALRGQLEKPKVDAVVAKFVQIEGWVYSSKSPIKHVEAFLDTISLGLLRYGQPRLDVTTYPSKAPINCGYEGTVLIDPSFVGHRTLTIRVTDQQGRVKDFNRMVQVIQEEEHAGAESGRSSGGGTGNRTTGALKIGKRTAELSLPASAEDDLSTAKRMLDSMSKISLESFLLSTSTIEFPVHEKPMTSIVLVLFNRAELTLQCLYSILKSKCDPYEVIIVDNASTDATRELLKRVKGVRIIENESNLHYLRACNQAARHARGEFLLLLNNDAQLQGDSIAAALKTLTSSPDIGAVGGRIILPDGTLQEAGSIIWQDGSCLGYGRGESPFAPEFMFKRDVDYCSAVFLLTRRAQFLAEGGFDEAFAPAYYEETDYCVRLWKEGKRVVYDPGVSVLHYEFASSASKQTAIVLQEEHREIFVAKHRKWLAAQPSFFSEKNLLEARMHRRGAKRILYLDDRVPHINLGSGFPRSNRILKALVEMGAQVSCYSLNFPEEEWQSVYRDIPGEVEVILERGRAGLDKFLMERAGWYDVIYVSRPHNLAILKSLLDRNPQLSGQAKIVYDAEAIFSLRNIESLRLQGKVVSEPTRQGLIDEELQLAQGCHSIISVSEREREEFVRSGHKDVYVLGHTLAPAPTPHSFEARKDILFVGAIYEFDSPNADSVIWFSKKILPVIRKMLGENVKFLVAGNIAQGIRAQLEMASVNVLGRVEDLTDLYNNARLFVAPTRFSAGIPHKVHEAAAQGLPVVATNLIGSQLNWQHETELLLADHEQDFASACVRLYQDRGLWNKLRRNALERIEIECSAEAFTTQLRTIIYGAGAK
jgi:GT2 family glycosyltransferase